MNVYLKVSKDCLQHYLNQKGTAQVLASHCSAQCTSGFRHNTPVISLARFFWTAVCLKSKPRDLLSAWNWAQVCSQGSRTSWHTNLDSAAKFAAVGDFLMFISRIPVSCGVQYELLLADCKPQSGVMNSLGNTDIIRFIKDLAGTHHRFCSYLI